MLLTAIRRILGRGRPRPAPHIPAATVIDDSGPVTIWEPFNLHTTLPPRLPAVPAPEQSYKTLHAILAAPSLDFAIRKAFRLDEQFEGEALFAADENVVLASIVARAYIGRFLIGGVARTAGDSDRLKLLYGGLIRSNDAAFRTFLSESTCPVDSFDDDRLKRVREVIRLFLR